MFQIDPANFQTQVASSEAAVAVAEASVNQTRRDQARLAPLVPQKKPSARKNLTTANQPLESAEATLKQVQAQANEARLNLSYTKGDPRPSAAPRASPPSLRAAWSRRVTAC